MREGDMYTDPKTGKLKIKPRSFMRSSGLPWAVIRKDKSMTPLFFCAGLAIFMCTSFSLFELCTNIDAALDKRDPYPWMRVKQGEPTKLVNFPPISHKQDNTARTIDDLPSKPE